VNAHTVEKPSVIRNSEKKTEGRSGEKKGKGWKKKVSGPIHGEGGYQRPRKRKKEKSKSPSHNHRCAQARGKGEKVGRQQGKREKKIKDEADVALAKKESTRSVRPI